MLVPWQHKKRGRAGFYQAGRRSRGIRLQQMFTRHRSIIISCFVLHSARQHHHISFMLGFIKIPCLFFFVFSLHFWFEMTFKEVRLSSFWMSHALSSTKTSHPGVLLLLRNCRCVRRHAEALWDSFSLPPKRGRAWSLKVTLWDVKSGGSDKPPSLMSDGLFHVRSFICHSSIWQTGFELRPPTQ